jgi:hypothetical protein
MQRVGVFLDIMSANRKALFYYKRTKVPQIYNASDHAYVIHEFHKKTTIKNRGHFKYATKDIDPETFFKEFDENKHKLIKMY